MASSTPDDILTTFGLSGDELGRFIASLTADARSILQDKLLHSKPLVDLSKLTDDLNEHRCSFVARESNNLQPSTRITDIASNYRQKSKAPGTLPNKSTYRENIVLEIMLLLFLLPAGSQIKVAQVDSEGTLMSRNLYIVDGQVFIITADHHNAPGFRGRFLPPDISQMLVLYLACVLPFQQTLDPSNCYSTSENLFAHDGGSWHTARYHRVLMRETKARRGVEMDLAKVNDLIRKMNVFLSESQAQ